MLTGHSDEQLDSESAWIFDQITKEHKRIVDDIRERNKRRRKITRENDDDDSKSKSVQCLLDECGKTPNGLRVRAITDIMGAQVVVTNDAKPEDDSLLSQPLENHSAAVELGKKVAEHGISIYNEWRGPISTMLEVIQIVL